MKNSPKLRFPEFVNSGEWVEKEFSNYIKLYRGSSPRPIQEYLTQDNNGVNWIKIGDTKNAINFIIDKVEEKITPKGAEKSRKVEIGELILANSMSFGKTYELKIEGCIYDGWFVLREYEEHFCKSFLLQLLNSEYMQQQYKKLSAGGIVQNISGDIVNKTMIFHTSLAEQQKIADCLSSVDSLILAQSQKVELLKEHKKGLLQNLFPSEGENVPRLRFPEFANSGEWEEKELGNLFNFLRGSVFSKADIIENGLNKCIHYGELFIIYKERITEIKSYTNIENGQFSQKNDILMPSSDVTPEGLATASAIFEDGIIIGGDVNLLRPKKEVNSLFVSYFLNLSKKEIMKLVSGTTVKHIYNKDISKLSIKLPSFNEQQKIADCLSSIDELITSSTKKVELLKEHKKGLLQNLFPSGEVNK
jgi:type I restriction enzyme S subunit